jgi:8-oxo-dGTP pyrophosphatase MutT (NUDIX family)
VFIARAVVVRQDYVLLGRGDDETFWTLPGGHVELGEMSDRALLREVAEELGVNARCGRLIWIVENHFIYRNRHCHEVGFYYHVELPADVLPLCSDEFTRCEPGVRFRWFPLSDIASVDIRPRFLAARLGALPDAPEHLQIDEIEAGLS